MLQSGMGLVLRHTKHCPVQVLCAHAFEITPLYESGTFYGLLGSAAIAAGVCALAFNCAKTAKAESAPLSIQYTSGL